MAADVRHTLLNLEITPPPGAWNAIASGLDIEFDTDEIKLSQKISDFELAPPAMAWANIEAAIVENPEEVEAAPVISINRSFRKWAAAAAAIVVLALGGWYFLDSSTAPNNEMTLVPQAKTGEKTNVPEVKNELPQASVAASGTRPLHRRSVTLAANSKKMIVSHASFETADQYFTEPDPIDSDYIAHTGMRYIQPVKASPLVEAPPIRDANGNIILDKELISASDNNYIVVTGPNGEQTRISSKFLPILSSLNGSNESNDYFQIFLNENNIWKLRFNEWRDKMLRQATFIPTATNLLDILELKDILMEN